MSRKSLIALAVSLAISTPVLAQGAGGGGAGGASGAGGGAAAASGAASGSAASSGAGTGTASSSANSGPSAPSGMGTQATTTGRSLNTNSQINNPNVEPPTANKTPSAVQAERNVGVGHAANGQPIGSPGTGTSNEDQKSR